MDTEDFQPGLRSVAFRIDAETDKLLVRFADRRGVSRSELVRDIVVATLEQGGTGLDDDLRDAKQTQQIVDAICERLAGLLLYVVSGHDLLMNMFTQVCILRGSTHEEGEKLGDEIRDDVKAAIKTHGEFRSFRGPPFSLTLPKKPDGGSVERLDRTLEKTA